LKRQWGLKKRGAIPVLIMTMKWTKKAIFPGLMLAVMLSACSLSQEVLEVSVMDSGDILVRRFPHAAVVDFPEKFSEKKVALYPEDDSSVVSLGKKLKASLVKAVNLAYEEVYPAGDLKIKEDVQRVLQFTIKESRVVYTADLMKSDIEDVAMAPSNLAVFAAAVTVVAYGDRYYRPGKKSVVRASSRFSRNDRKEKEIAAFRKAVDIVVQRISYEVANLLFQGYAEPGRANERASAMNVP